MNDSPTPASLKKKKEALQRGERAPARAFRIVKQPDGTHIHISVDPETQRCSSAKAWDAQSEIAKVRETLSLTQEAFADLLGIKVATLRSWEQGKREPSGAARMLITIALRHPGVLEEMLA